MDFINLNTEYETLNQFSKQGVMTLTNLNSFFKTMHKYSDLFYLNTKKSNDVMFNELLKFDSKSTLSKNFFEFYRNYESFMGKLKTTMGKIEKELIEPINLFSKHLTSKYSECLSEYKSIAYSTYESKKNLEKTKHKYFDSCKSSVEQEKVVLRVMNEQGSDAEVENAHDVLIKLRLQAENNCQSYKCELAKTNKQFEENEKKYFPLIDKMKNNEEARENFLKFHFEKFTLILEDFSSSLQEMLQRMSNDAHEIKVDEDMKLVDEKMNFLYKPNERIPKEEFLNYEIYRRNLEKMLSGVSTVIGSNLNSAESVNSFTTMTHDEDLSSSTSAHLMNNYSSNKDKVDLEDHCEITNFFNNLKDSQAEISIDELTKFMSNLEENIPFSKTFIDKVLVCYKKSVYVEFMNYQNLHHFANILVTITNNTEIKKELFEMNFAVIYISEKTFYANPNNSFNKVYLCKLLSQNKIYTDRKFWIDLMNLKINSLIEQKIASELSKREKENSGGYLNHYGSNDISSPNRGFLSIGSRMKSLFTQTIVKENKKIESSMIQSSLYEQIKATEASNVVKEYILHFANFTFDVSEAIDIIVELSSVYNYEKEKVSFFISLLNSNYFTIKNKPLVPIINIDYNSNFMSKDFKGFNKLNDNTMSIFAQSLKYIQLKEYPNILTLNKKFHRKFSRIVYKNILNRYHDMDIKTRMTIWKSILDVNEIKRNLNYSEVLNEISDQNELLEPIILDVQRTAFDGEDIEIKRAAITNILKVIAYKKPNVNYCQGMNYIAAYIYQLTNNEEEAFYLFYAIMTKTEYSDIFLDELSKLKRFFYVFERLIFIYLPELQVYLKNNSISVSYFISPWFITLFTSAYQHVNNFKKPKIILRIWDQFLLNGWKAVLKSGLCLMKHYESNLLQLKYEELLHFLINDVLKYGFFHNTNYDYFVKINKNIKLESGLLSNLENEFYLENKVKESEEKRIETQQKIAYEKEHSIKI